MVTLAHISYSFCYVGGSTFLSNDLSISSLELKIIFICRPKNAYRNKPSHFWISWHRCYISSVEIYAYVLQVFLEFYAFSIDKNVDDDIVITRNKNEISASRQELLSAKCTIYFFRY